jgi:hypothetical protein
MSENTAIETSTQPHTSVSWSWSSSEKYDAAYLAQRIFGTLVKLAQPVVREYQGDLFWDADSVSKITGPVTFYYTVRDMGTGYSETLDHLASVKSVWPNSHSYKCVLSTHNGVWYFEASLLDNAELAKSFVN